jgi:ligand-binding sensor domain-containing protein
MKAAGLTLALMLPVNLSAQQQRIRFDHISLEHGLSQSIVRVIFQDSKGFLWFGAQDRLNKYNGYNPDFALYAQNRHQMGFKNYRKIGVWLLYVQN